jgi:PAS domain S-box-containing protein
MLSQRKLALSQPPKSSLRPGQPRARERSHVTASLLASIVESSDDGIYSIDDGIITSWNRGAEQLFGYTADEAVGKPVVMLLPLDRLDEEIAILESIKRGEAIKHYETECSTKDGRRIPVSITISPIKKGAGAIVGALRVARDISQRKAAEEKENILRRELQHRTNNLLAVIQAIAERSLSVNNRPLAQIKALFMNRLYAMARTHHGWRNRTGAVQTSSISSAPS